MHAIVAYTHCICSGQVLSVITLQAQNERLPSEAFAGTGNEDAAAYDGGIIVVMTIPVTRKSGVVGRSVVINSSAPLDFAAAI
jgi:hypothetical protein